MIGDRIPGDAGKSLFQRLSKYLPCRDAFAWKDGLRWGLYSGEGDKLSAVVGC